MKLFPASSSIFVKQSVEHLDLEREKKAALTLIISLQRLKSRTTELQLPDLLTLYSEQREEE